MVSGREGLVTRLDREGHKPDIWLRANQIKTKPDLFQPRTITAIRAGGNKPPPLAIKLRDEGYVVVDGHHTITAYKGADKGLFGEQ